MNLPDNAQTSEDTQLSYIDISTDTTKRIEFHPGNDEPLIYMSFPLVYAEPPEPPDFFSLRLAAKSMLSISDATVRTPPTTAHVLSVDTISFKTYA